MSNEPFIPAAAPTRRFGPSRRALGQRRALVYSFKAGLWVCALLAARQFWPTAGVLVLVLTALLLALAWGLWRWQGLDVLLTPLAERELTLHAQALELRRGDFKRFVVFESLRHIRVVQVPGGRRLISLRLELDDDSLLLRDLDGLPEAFAALVGAKPDKTLVEIDEQSVDWGEPLPWALVALAAILLAWVAVAL